MFTQFSDGKALLSRFVELMASGNRQAALLFRDSLPPLQLEAYYRTFKSPWITGGTTDAVCTKWALALALDEVSNPVEMLRDLGAIAAAHGIPTTIELDESRRTVKLTCGSGSDLVRKVMQQWMKGYARESARGKSVQASSVDLSKPAPWAASAAAR